VSWGWRQTPRDGNTRTISLRRTHLEHLFCFDLYLDTAEGHPVEAHAREYALHSTIPKHAMHWAKQPTTMSIIGDNKPQIGFTHRHLFQGSHTLLQPYAGLYILGLYSHWKLKNQLAQEMSHFKNKVHAKMCIILFPLC